MRLSNLALDELTEGLNRGWGGREFCVAMLIQEERAGVNIAVDEQALGDALERDARGDGSSDT
jgi:hypothetical protein